MNKSAPNNERINVGDTVQLSNIVQMPGLLQLSFGTSYQVVNVGRANNPNNDHIYVLNDHGRVVSYLARIFQRVEKIYLVYTDEGIFLGKPAIYVNPEGQRIIILALPDYPVEYGFEEMAGLVLVDETGYRKYGELYTMFSPELFKEIN